MRTFCMRTGAFLFPEGRIAMKKTTEIKEYPYNLIEQAFGEKYIEKMLDDDPLFLTISFRSPWPIGKTKCWICVIGNI